MIDNRAFSFYAYNLTTEIELDTSEAMDIISSTVTDLKSVATSITAGNIGFKIEQEGGCPKLTFIVTSDDIFPDSDTVNQEITVEISYKIVPKPSSGNNYEIDWEKVRDFGLTIALLGLIAAGAYYLIPELLAGTGALVFI
ncbi:hypothetical protein [Thomasclavelia spiroformis]|uniref:hypothetical protein n=1 Tax=Thomasclavelia spiroformis TaxID=29348 RepID=UPI0026DC4B12|nr:hypothetical protein [Thomasclavelia spiroformis]